MTSSSSSAPDHARAFGVLGCLWVRFFSGVLIWVFDFVQRLTFGDELSNTAFVMGLWIGIELNLKRAGLGTEFEEFDCVSGADFFVDEFLLPAADQFVLGPPGGEIEAEQAELVFGRASVFGAAGSDEFLGDDDEGFHARLSFCAKWPILKLCTLRTNSKSRSTSQSNHRSPQTLLD